MSETTTVEFKIFLTFVIIYVIGNLTYLFHVVYRREKLSDVITEYKTAKRRFLTDIAKADHLGLEWMRAAAKYKKIL